MIAGTTAGLVGCLDRLGQGLGVDLGHCGDGGDGRSHVIHFGLEDANVHDRSERDELFTVAVEDRGPLLVCLNRSKPMAVLTKSGVNGSARPVDEPGVVYERQGQGVVRVLKGAELGHIPGHPDLGSGI